MRDTLEYEALRRQFSWDDVVKLLDRDAAGLINLAHELVDRHAASDAIALPAGSCPCCRAL